MEITQMCVICVALTGLVKGEGVLPGDSLNASFGGSATFPTTFTPQEGQFTVIDWKLNGATIIFYNDMIVASPGYENRTNISLSTGSLELRNLALNDSGQYRVIITPKQKPSQEGSTELNVYVPVSGIVVFKTEGDLVETNSTVRLSCSSSGSSLSYLWLNGSSEVTASDRVQITDGGSALNINKVTRYDQGPFRCHAFNPISKGTSDPVNFSINYGPEKTRVQPESQYYGIGSNITLKCSAVSVPPAQFNWFVNGVRLPETGPELGLHNVQQNQNGNYSCQSFNWKTLRYDTSQSQAVTILETISNVFLLPSTTAIEERPLNLTCDAAGGSIFSRDWSKDGLPLDPADNVTLANHSRVLSFASLRKSDSGKYACNISNFISSRLATYALSVSYGPEAVKIAGPAQIQMGQSLSLSCSSQSDPLANYTWTLKEAELSSSPELSFVVRNLSDSGNYTCHAANSVTGRTLSAVHAVSVTENFAPACSTGCIAGITVSCVVLLAVVIAGSVVCSKRAQKKRKNMLPSVGFSQNAGAVTGRGGGQENTAYVGSQELNYASLDTLPQSKNGAPRQLELQESTEYAQIRASKPSTTPLQPPPYEVHMQRAQRRQDN